MINSNDLSLPSQHNGVKWNLLFILIFRLGQVSGLQMLMPKTAELTGKFPENSPKFSEINSPCYVPTH